MLKYIIQTYYKHAFDPSQYIGVLINPFYIIRRKLVLNVKDIANRYQGGRLLDLGCGSKPYEHLFSVDEYIGVDIEISGHDHRLSKIDKYYDGKVIPFRDGYFDIVFSSEVFEHVFNLKDILNEINRVLKPGGILAFTCPFAWEEHEQPYDYARYTSFALISLMKEHSFEIVTIKKSTNHFETLMQLFTSYISLHILPKNKWLKIIFGIFTVAPLNIIGVLLGKILPDSENLYHNNIVTARKI